MWTLVNQPGSKRRSGLVELSYSAESPMWRGTMVPDIYCPLESLSHICPHREALTLQMPASPFADERPGTCFSINPLINQPITPTAIIYMGCQSLIFALDCISGYPRVSRASHFLFPIHWWAGQPQRTDRQLWWTELSLRMSSPVGVSFTVVHHSLWEANNLVSILQ